MGDCLSRKIDCPTNPSMKTRRSKRQRAEETTKPDGISEYLAPTTTSVESSVLDGVDVKNLQAIERTAGLEQEVVSLKNKVALLQAELDIKRPCVQGGSGLPNNHDKSGIICKINHIARICADAEASRAFYQALGATLLNRPNFPSPGYWLWLGNAQLHLIQGAHASEEATHAKGIPTGNVNHLSFEVHDFDGVEASLKRLNMKYKKNLVPEGSGVIHQLFLTDPDGHFVEICDCNLFNDFVFGPPPDKEKSARLASKYLEGVDPTNATIAAAVALSFIPGGDDESIGNLQRVFKVLAKDTEYIERSDLSGMLTRMGHQVTEEETAEIISKGDTEGDGRMSFSEFAEWMGPKLNPHRSTEELRNAFNIIDRDGNGFLTADELLLMLWGMGIRMDNSQLEATIKNADNNGDGKIDVEEFLGVFQKITPKI